MRNFILSAMSAGLLFAFAPATPASAAVRANINLNFGEPPRVYFVRQPRMILIPDTQVYYVEGTDYDMFQCDGVWYVDNGGYWFEAPSYRGPFVSVSFQDVPREVIGIPSAYAHQPYRPGMWRSDSRQYYGYSRSYRSYNRGWQNNDNRGWQQPPQNNDNRNWRNSDQRWQDRQTVQRGTHGGQGNQGNGRGHGNGKGRGHDKNHGDDN